MKESLWQPSKERVGDANMIRFIEHVNAKYGRQFRSYDELYRWSIDSITDFWSAACEFAPIKFSRGPSLIVDDLRKMPGARWFDGAKLNFAENLLRYRDEHTALIFKGEAQNSISITYSELYDRVARLAASLRAAGVGRGDRVVGFMPNMMETVVAMLAATSLGAVWSSCSPDFGANGVLDRFRQIEPKILFTADGYRFRGTECASLERVADIVSQLPSIERVVVVPYLRERPDISRVPHGILYDDFAAKGSGQEIGFEQVPFEHPLYIMYSSGTTGLPKCLVQSTGGVLLQHIKELQLHVDLKRDDRIFYFTTCGWMMWNWLVSSLALGATVVLYDGAPLYPEAGALWRMCQDERITVFGTSARYLAVIEKEGVKPAQTYDLRGLRTILSTGSPLPAEGFRYVYREVKQDVLLASISGGTDINGCFALGNPLLPVFAGELQCRGLGMKVEAFNESGESVINERGELVCTAPFPSMPIRFWNDPGGEKYLKSYFSKYPGAWAHGDYIKITETGGVVIYGRSDATLNPGGVRIGTAEIYRRVETLPEIADGIVVGQNWQDDVRIVLFVKLAEGVELTEELKEKIRRTIRENTTPRHVPAKIIAVADIPYTINMKKVELAVRNVVHNEPVLNRDALLNPEALDLYQDLPELAS